MDWTAFWTAVGALAAVFAIYVGSVRHTEHRLGKFMTREEHERLCCSRDTTRKQMHDENKKLLESLQDQMQEQGSLLAVIGSKIAVLEENKRLREQLESRGIKL